MKSKHKASHQCCQARETKVRIIHYREGLYPSAQKKRLPGWFAHLDRRGLPRRAVLVLGSVFVVMAGVSAVFPSALVGLFTVASSVFLLLYLLCLLSYLRVTPSFGKRLLSGVLFAFLLATLLSVGLKILYPLVVFLLALAASLARESRRASHLRQAEGGINDG